mmetsp:Transcript_23382/g.39667  ORF Transcript_23382/g.39667 Transcript_23382/m.39667 type:complete len:205 (+) Transcript_23382:859-1473(+)
MAAIPSGVSFNPIFSASAMAARKSSNMSPEAIKESLSRVSFLAPRALFLPRAVSTNLPVRPMRLASANALAKPSASSLSMAADRRALTSASFLRVASISKQYSREEHDDLVRPIFEASAIALDILAISRDSVADSRASMAAFSASKTALSLVPSANSGAVALIPIAEALDNAVTRPDNSRTLMASEIAFTARCSLIIASFSCLA